MARTVLIIGAHSPIAAAVAKQLTANGNELFLLARNAGHQFGGG